MSAGLFDGLPPVAQAFLYGFIGLGVTGAAIISYLKGLKKPAPASAPVAIIGGDVDRLIKAIDRLDDSLQRQTDAVRDSNECVRTSTETTARLYRHVAAQAAMPPNEEILVLLQAINDRMQNGWRHGNKPA